MQLYQDSIVGVGRSSELCKVSQLHNSAMITSQNMQSKKPSLIPQSFNKSPCSLKKSKKKGKQRADITGLQSYIALCLAIDQ